MIDADRLVEEVRSQISILGRDYVNALLVAILGKDAAGVSTEDVARLVRIGMLRERETGGIVMAGGDPWYFAQMMGKLTSSMTPAEIEASRDWSLDTWIRRVENADEPDLPEEGDEEAAQGIRIDPIFDNQPTGMTPRQQDAWRQSITRAGEFARGLGNSMMDEMGEVVTEIWDGETPTFIPDEARRDTFLEAVREATSEAVARGWTAQKLASEIGHRTGDWARDLLRIARTELQGAYNDSVVMQAVKVWGQDVRIARIPEAGACDACRALFLDEEGRPKIFTVKQISMNGTNVGRRLAEWLPTIWPVHPNCRCGTIAVPDGFTVDENGRLDWGDLTED